MRNKNFFIILFISIFLISCSKDNIKKSIIEEKSLDLQVLDAYREGMESLKGGDVLFAAKKFNEAELLYPQSAWASKSALMAAYSYYAQDYYEDAIAELDRFLKVYPKDQNINYAYYLLATSYYETIVDEKKDLESIINAKKYFNTGSLIDYYLLNVYTVNADWLNWNTAWWRGTDPDGDKKKWRYALWDFDNTFDHGANYTGIPNTDPDSDPCDPEGMGNVGGQGHIPILNALFNNEDFVADYINRWADLGNSYFSCDFMTQHLDSLINLIDPEMPAQINTWGGNINTWQNNVQDLKDFILDRCNTINSGIVDCYDVTGPYNVTVIINGIGEVQFSDIFINELNSGWSGEYFGDVNIPAEIVNGNFSYWEIVSNGNYIYDPFDPNLTLNLTSDITLIAYFDANGITYLTNPINEGTITENGNIITNFPYSKSYIDGDIINLNGAANTGWEISHWSSSNHNFTPDSISSDVSITINGGDTIVLHLDKIELTTTILIDPPNSNGEVYLNGDIIEGFPKIDVHDYGTNISVSATSKLTLPPLGSIFGTPFSTFKKSANSCNAISEK